MAPGKAYYFSPENGDGTPPPSAGFPGGMSPRMFMISMMLSNLMVLAMAGASLGVAVVAYNVASSAATVGPPGPVGVTGATGPEGPEGPTGASGASLVNSTNGITLETDPVGENITLSWGGTLTQDTLIQQDGNSIRMLYPPYLETDIGYITIADLPGGAFVTSLNDFVSVSGSIVLDDGMGSKRATPTALWNLLGTPLIDYQLFDDESKKRLGGHLGQRAVVGIQSVLVHGSSALDDLSIVLSQEFGAGIINLDPNNKNAQIVVTDFGVSINTETTGVEFNLGNGDLFIRGLDEDTSHTAGQILVRDSGSQQVMWSTLTDSIGVDNGLSLDGTTIEWGGTLIQNTQIDQDTFIYTQTFDGHDTVIIDAAVVVSPTNGELIVEGLVEDPNNSDQNMVRYSGNGQVSWVERSPTTVYTNNADPNSATVFSYNYPPTFNNPFAEENERYYYVGSDGSLWRYDTGTLAYVSFGFSFVATPEMAGSSCQIYTSGALAVDATSTPHVFDSMMMMWGTSVFCGTSSIIVRNGGIYEIVAEEYLDSSTASDFLEYGIYADGSLIAGSNGYASNDGTIGTTSKAARAILKADGPFTITIETVSFTGTPSIGPNSSVSVKQLYWFS